MGAVWFYHLTRTSVEATLPALLEKALAAGWRVEVRSGDARRLDALDRALWITPPEGFLPHARAGGAQDTRQPVLLTGPGEPAANGAACLMALDGAPFDAEEAARLERTCLLFDGLDPEAVEAARRQWRSLTAAGLRAAYWAEEGSGWTKKAEA